MEKQGITEAQVAAVAGGGVVERGLQNKKWVLALLRAIDKYVPHASGASIALITNDVYQYLRNPGLRDTIEEGVREALWDQTPMVVVGHSLGTVVCYNMLRREGKKFRWQVPLLLTLDHFKVKPPIENLTHVKNGTDNRHGIAGYLDDKIVARRIYDALNA